MSGTSPKKSNKKRVGVVMGSKSDLETMKEAVNVLKEFGLGFDIDVISCHRAPQLAHDYATGVEEKDYEVVIAGAGGAAALPGVLASLTTVPVIGVPVVNQGLGGGDALYSMVHMPSGVPVAVAGVGKTGAVNAAILAVEILGVQDSGLRVALADYKKKLAEGVEKGSEEVKRELGVGD
ncbi:MAG: 5-(carboxyamino)imidazole ribonucleotide mutase [Planctomycetota bacterium]